MATLIPAISACVSRMTSGERRVAERLEQRLDNDYLAQAHKEGFSWGDMAVLCAHTLARRKLPVESRLGSGDFDPTSNKIKVMTMKVSKGLVFPVVALPGVGGREGSYAGVLCGSYTDNAEAAYRSCWRWTL